MWCPTSMLPLATWKTKPVRWMANLAKPPIYSRIADRPFSSYKRSARQRFIASAGTYLPRLIGENL